MSNIPSKEAMLRIAKDYEHLAEWAEERAKRSAQSAAETRQKVRQRSGAPHKRRSQRSHPAFEDVTQARIAKISDLAALEKL